ncbi:hypothetical protein NKH18_32220 [Streptomyces sp. M10(2022)]
MPTSDIPLAAEDSMDPVPERRDRPRPRFLVLALVFVCLLGAGIAWHVQDSSGASSCEVVRDDRRVEKALGHRYDGEWPAPIWGGDEGGHAG